MFLGFESRGGRAVLVPAVGARSGVERLLPTCDALDADQGLEALLIASFFAFLSGYLAIAGLLRFLANHTTYVFVVYRVALGVLVLALTGAGVIS